MGGGISIQVPLSQTQTTNLKAEYEKRKALGQLDDEIGATFKEALPAIIVFNQIDCDHDGTLSRREISRLLRALPRHKPVPPPGGWPEGGGPPPFVPVEQLVDILDADKDGVISLLEFVENLKHLPALKASIEAHVDPVSGKITTYKSLEHRLHEYLEVATQLEAAAAAANGDVPAEDAAKLAELRGKIADIQAQVGTAGITVFKQIDADGSGKVDRAELLGVLRALTTAHFADAAADAAEAISIDAVLKELDSDGDGLIDEDEWIMQLDRQPLLKAFLTKYIDPRTGKIIGYEAPAPWVEAPPGAADVGIPAVEASA
jgi:Ca2+-binding EF-hand superfamily protein